MLTGFFISAGIVVTLWVVSNANLPDNLGQVLINQEKAETISRNSPLTEYVHLSPNADFPRQNKIQKITVHHMAGNLSLEYTGELFSNRDRGASANYGIDSNGKIALYVEEANRAWSSSNVENDQQAVTIEVANDETGGEWHVSDAAYAALVDLCTDICQRNGMTDLTFTGDATGTLTLHKMFKETECPGAYLESRMPSLAQSVNARLHAKKSD